MKKDTKIKTIHIAGVEYICQASVKEYYNLKLESNDKTTYFDKEGLFMYLEDLRAENLIRNKND